MGAKERWANKLSDFLPDFVAGHRHLGVVAEAGALLLHGSTARGIDDEVSDLDVWMLLSEEALERLRESIGKRHFEIGGLEKPGHLNVESLPRFRNRIRRCDLPLINELRHSALLEDPTGEACKLVAAARLPMRQVVSKAFFLHHYIGMRRAHRLMDNPMERHDSLTVLIGVGRTVREALRAAVVADDEPYPHDKWLFHTASEGPVGSALVEPLERLRHWMGQGVENWVGSELGNPLSQELREVRKVLMQAARRRDWAGPWLRRWSEHLDEAQGLVEKVRWPVPP